jgi:hypothetical protein
MVCVERETMIGHASRSRVGTVAAIRAPEDGAHTSMRGDYRAPFACSRAHVSLSVTVRLKTGRPGLESGSTQK